MPEIPYTMQRVDPELGILVEVIVNPVTMRGALAVYSLSGDLKQPLTSGRMAPEDAYFGWALCWMVPAWLRAEAGRL